MSESIVVVGGGHAGAQLCASLVAQKQNHQIHLVCAESHLPYQRPPLSKSFLMNRDELALPIRLEAWFAASGVDLHLADPVMSIDRPGRHVELQSGKKIPYDKLVLATGVKHRELAELNAMTNVVRLRTVVEAEQARTRLVEANDLTIIGGGFIGLEVAATARALGKSVRVLEVAPRLLGRSASPQLSDYVAAKHREMGTEIMLGCRIDSYEIDRNRVSAVVVDGHGIAVDLLLSAVGSIPECSLARDAGLDCGNGVVVDEMLKTSDPQIFAVGDCASFPDAFSNQRIRLESIQNANDQSRALAATLSGKPQNYRAIPWFWSDQGDLRLQMAGLVAPDATCHRRPGADDDSFSFMHYVGSRLACVESVSAPADHLAARKLMAAGLSPPPDKACDGAIPLKSWL